MDVTTRTSLRFCAWMLAACLLACASDSPPEPSACVQSRQQPRHFELATRCALEQAGLRPDSPEAKPRIREVTKRFLAAGITPEDVTPQRWKELTRPLIKRAPPPAARKRPSSSEAGSTSTPPPAPGLGLGSSGIEVRTERIIQERLETASEAELFLAIAYGQIPHERAREPLIQRGLVREKHRQDVRSGNLAVGMSDLEVVLSRGPVADVFTVKAPSGVRRQLIYRQPDWLVTTEDGFVTSWEAGAASPLIP